jgi:hypothetical protein
MGTQGGGSSGHGGSHREGAARTSPACERRCYGSVRQKSREGRGSHHADKPRAKTMASARRRRGRSTRWPELEDGGGAPSAARSSNERAVL